MLDFAAEIKPHHACLVPEKREELTTEGGLNVIEQFKQVEIAVKKLKNIGSDVSLFIDPEIAQIDAAKALDVSTIELHTGCYADAQNFYSQKRELDRLIQSAHYANSLNIIVNAGHGLHYHNVEPIANIKEINELNIGHAIIARSIFCGLKQAVIDMRLLLDKARSHVTY